MWGTSYLGDGDASFGSSRKVYMIRSNSRCQGKLELLCLAHALRCEEGRMERCRDELHCRISDDTATLFRGLRCCSWQKRRFTLLRLVQGPHVGHLADATGETE